MRISIIIPVYNVENYLHYAMDSLFRQTYKNFEVILVNDGSTDNSGKLCEEYAQEYDNVFVYHKKNAGLSDARNFGVENAKTDWIFFLDPDDYIEPFTLELLVELQRKYNVDLISTKVQSTDTFNNYNDFKFTDLDLTSTVKVTKEKALEFMLENRIATVSACAKLYHKKVLQEVPFPVGKIYEDFFVVAEHLKIAGDIVICPIVTYHYYSRPGSIVNSKFSKSQYDFFDAGENNRRAIQKYYEDPNLEKFLNLKIVKGAFAISSLAANSAVSELTQIHKKISPYYFEIISNRKEKIRFKIKYSLILLIPRIFYKVKSKSRKEN